MTPSSLLRNIFLCMTYTLIGGRSSLSCYFYIFFSFLFFQLHLVRRKARSDHSLHFGTHINARCEHMQQKKYQLFQKGCKYKSLSCSLLCWFFSLSSQPGRRTPSLVAATVFVFCRSHLRLCAAVRVVFGGQVWDDEAVVTWAVYSSVTDTPQGQLLYLPAVRALGDVGNDCIGETWHHNVVWKKIQIQECLKKSCILKKQQQKKQLDNHPIILFNRLKCCSKLWLREKNVSVVHLEYYFPRSIHN